MKQGPISAFLRPFWSEIQKLSSSDVGYERTRGTRVPGVRTRVQCVVYWSLKVRPHLSLTFYVWTLFYGPTWNPTPWVVNSEMFDNASRPIAQTTASASNWLYNFAISQGTPHMFATMGYGVYLFFASMMVCSIVYVFFLLPETKGIPLEEMDNLFARRPVWRAHGELVEELRIRAQENTSQANYNGQVSMLHKRNDGVSSDASSANDKEDSTKIETA